MLLHRATRSLLWSTALLLLPAFGGAQGFALNEIGTCAVGRSFAATAGGCSDASLIFWNPAGTVRLNGWSVLAGTAAISLNGAFKRDTNGNRYESDIPVAIVPHVFINHHAKGSKLSLGAGLYVPYGLQSQWGDSFPGRFTSKNAKLQTIYVQPNIAWQLNDDWSIGGGPIWATSSVELEQAIDLSSNIAAPATATTPAITFAQLGIPKYTEIGRAHIEGSGTGLGAQVGIMGKVNDRWTIGARYLLPITFKYKSGDAVFRQINTGLVFAGPLTGIPAGTQVDTLVGKSFLPTGRLSPQHVSTQITHPAQVQVGFNYSGMKAWNIEVDYQWTQWSRFKELPVNFDTVSLSKTLVEDYKNSSALRISAEHAFTNGARFRLGVSGVTTAAPDVTVSPLLPEQERAYYTGGGSYPLFGNLTLDGSVAYIATLGRRGRTDEYPGLRRYDWKGDIAPSPIGPTQINNGVYTLKAYIFSVSLKASY